jgi:hypothetical protein
LNSEPEFVGWVERSDTHQYAFEKLKMGIASLNPSYGLRTTDWAGKEEVAD